jgi:TatD DNase family protein
VTDDRAPALDCHAHIAPDVTTEELDRLGNVLVFAMTRSIPEAEAVLQRRDPKIVWGCGIHPGVQPARESYSASRFERLVPTFAVVGEIGMDRRAGHLPEQESILREIMAMTQDAPVLLSIHSAGCARDVLGVIKAHPHLGAILHWFLGTESEVQEAIGLGCYFSVNGAMQDDQIRRIPIDRLLPETDYPSTARRGGGRLPGDVANLAGRIGKMHGLDTDEVSYRWRRNLLALATRSGALDRLPEAVADALLSG